MCIEYLLNIFVILQRKGVQIHILIFHQQVVMFYMVGENMEVEILTNHTNKNMKLISIISLLLFGQLVVAQTTFSITPLVNYKLLFCGYGHDATFGFYFENQPSHLHNPYYEFGAKRISHRPSINIGVRLMASLNDDKHLITTEWSQDEAGTMSKTYSFATANTTGMPPASYNTYGIGVSYFQTAFVYNRYSLYYGCRLTKKTTLSKVYFMTDLSLARTVHNSMEWYYENSPDNNSVYYHNNAKRVSTTYMAKIRDGTYFKAGIGFKADLTVPIKKKPIYLFSFETHYRQGFRTMVSGGQKTVINDNNQLVAFHNGLISKGSGIYFQISRNIKLFTLKPKTSLHH